MKIHFLQHVAFEGLACIEPMLLAKGHQLTATHFYMEQKLLTMEEFDALIIMGGPMSVKDEKHFPWLKKEKIFIKSAINQGKKVLGICLGAQLIAEQLGAEITLNPKKEIGWFPIKATNSALNPYFPPELEVFHWHGETFTLPQGAISIGSSEACINQGFIFQERVIALQFHLETTEKSLTALIKHCSGELDDSHFVQDESEMLSKPKRFNKINQSMQDLLNHWLEEK